MAYVTRKACDGSSVSWSEQSESLYVFVSMSTALKVALYTQGAVLSILLNKELLKISVVKRVTES